MRPRTSSPVDAARRPAPATVRGRAPALLGLAGHVHLHQHGRARRPPGDLRPSVDAVDALPQVDERGELAHLVALEAADEVPAAPRRSDDRVGLGQQLLGVVLADVGQPGGRAASVDRVGAEALGDRHDARPRSGSPPAAAIRRRTAATRSTASSGSRSAGSLIGSSQATSA